MSDRYSRGDLISLAVPGDPDDAVRRAAEDFLHDLWARNYSVRTIEIRREHLVQFVTWAHDQDIVTLDGLSRSVLERYRGWLHSSVLPHGKTRTAATQSVRITSIRAFCRFLTRSGRIDTNPAQYLEPPRTQRPMPRVILSRAEVEMVLHQPDLTTAFGIRDRAIMEVLFATGIRRAELVRLTLDDVNFAQRTVTVRQGKGGRSRIVPISPRALEWISRYLEIRRTPSKSEEARVLFVNFRRQMFGLVNLSKTIRQYIEAAGIGKTGSCHTFRATTATMMLEGGADIRFVQEMLGHASILTTQVYTRVSVSALQRVYDSTHPSAKAG